MIWQAKNSVMTSKKLGINLCDTAHIVIAVWTNDFEHGQGHTVNFEKEMVIKKSINQNKELYCKAQYQ